MPESAKRHDPFVAFRFVVRLDDIEVGGFSECSGLQIETETHDYNEGGFNMWVHKFPGRNKQTNITLKHGIAGRMLCDWYERQRQGNIELKGGTITVFDPTGSAKTMEWDFKEAFVCKWIGPDLNASQSNVAVETIELCHMGLYRRQ